MTDSILSKKTLQDIDHWVAKFPADQKQSASLQALHIVQDAHEGYLTPELIEAVALYLEMPVIAVKEVATFYSMYEHTPRGQHKICVCTNVSCMLRGSEEIVDHLEKRLGIKMGETTADGKFGLKEVECLAACVNAPMCQIGKKYYERLTPKRVDEIIADLEAQDGQ